MLIPENPRKKITRATNVVMRERSESIRRNSLDAPNEVPHKLYSVTVATAYMAGAHQKSVESLAYCSPISMATKNASTTGPIYMRTLTARRTTLSAKSSRSSTNCSATRRCSSMRTMICGIATGVCPVASIHCPCTTIASCGEVGTRDSVLGALGSDASGGVGAGVGGRAGPGGAGGGCNPLLSASLIVFASAVNGFAKNSYPFHQCRCETSFFVPKWTKFPLKTTEERRRNDRETTSRRQDIMSFLYTTARA